MDICLLLMHHYLRLILSFLISSSSTIIRRFWVGACGGGDWGSTIGVWKVRGGVRGVGGASTMTIRSLRCGLLGLLSFPVSELDLTSPKQKSPKSSVNSMPCSSCIASSSCILCFLLYLYFTSSKYFGFQCNLTRRLIKKFEILLPFATSRAWWRRDASLAGRFITPFSIWDIMSSCWMVSSLIRHGSWMCYLPL